jgi:hypothetical protein
MKNCLVVLLVLSSATLLAGCSYDQAVCSHCAYTVKEAATSMRTPTTGYAAPRCCTSHCCPSCNRCGAAYYGYGAGYGVEYNTTTWY